MTVQGSSSKR